MPEIDAVVMETATEFKFVGDGAPGTFEGYGSVYNVMDAHGDVVAPGAFDASLLKHQQNGTMPAMFVEHSAFLGGDPLPVGKWEAIEPDGTGLKMKGKLLALDTDGGRRLAALMKEGVIGGLSIAFTVPPGGARIGKKQGEPRRTLHMVDLHAVDIVRDPSNSAARINQLRSRFIARLKAAGDPADPDEAAFTGPNVDEAIDMLARALVLQDRMMTNGGYGSPKDHALIMNAMQEAYEALTGDAVPDGLDGWIKSIPTMREIERMLREEFRLSRSQASAVAERRFKPSTPRDEGKDDQAVQAERKAAVSELSASLAGFSLPKL